MSDTLIELRAPGSRPIEVSIDGGPYRPAKFSAGAWRVEWRSALDEDEIIVAVVRARRTATEVP